MATVELTDKSLSITDFNILAALIAGMTNKWPLAEATTEDQFPSGVTVTVTGELVLSGD